LEACRPAASPDLERIAALAREMQAELEAMRGGAVWAAREARPEPLIDGYAALLDRDDARLIVGTIDDVIVGFGAAQIEQLRDGTVLGVVTDLFVEPPARAIGVGETINNDLISFFRAHQCIGIDAWALPGHRATKNFFEESGFTARAIIMHHRLARSDDEPADE
jgi:GNAT superfamily N-acetyltransferase